MARLMTIKDYPPYDLALMIDHSVGKKGRNRHDDVQVVQFLLNSANHQGVSFFEGAMKSDLVVDGICGPLTLDAIASYQKTINKGAGVKDMVEDGTVNAIQATTFTRGNSVFTPTICHLNYYFWSRVGYE